MPRAFGITNAAPYASAPAVGASGDTYWNTTSKILYVSDGAAWNAVTGSGGPPSGAAGGDLAGSTYPNPTIAAAAVTLAKLAKLAPIYATAYGTINGAQAVGPTEAILADLVPSAALDAGRWALILALLPVVVANVSGVNQSTRLTMTVRIGGTAGTADGTVVTTQLCDVGLSTGQTIPTRAIVLDLYSPAASVSRIKVGASQNNSSVGVTTEWNGSLLVLQLA